MVFRLTSKPFRSRISLNSTFLKVVSLTLTEISSLNSKLKINKNIKVTIK